MDHPFFSFSAKIYKIGINPYVLLPAKVLKGVFAQSQKDKGSIPVRGTMNGHEYLQTLVKYSGKWRLYLNTPMRKNAKADVGDTADFTIAFDPAERLLTMHPKLAAALKKNKEASRVFESLPPSKKKEVIRYIGALKTEISVDRNVQKAINFLCGKERFIGRDKP